MCYADLVICDPSTGRSMGCRAAVALARQLSKEELEEVPQGVICLSFPMHPPKTHTHQQRSEDLRALPEHLPVLFVSGTEDQMCDRVRTIGSFLLYFIWRDFCYNVN